jgi:hypothetical protein
MLDRGFDEDLRLVLHRIDEVNHSAIPLSKKLLQTRDTIGLLGGLLKESLVPRKAVYSSEWKR